MKFCNLYEINSRVWIKRFQHHNSILSISQIPDEYWLKLKNLGMDYIWLMGVWETVPSSIDKYCFVDGLKTEYSKALPDWEKADVIGSPYAINEYKLNPLLGINEELKSLKRQLNNHGLKLILDFIPNHFHADSELLKTHPEIFLAGNNDLLNDDSLTFYTPESIEGVYAHGKDPNFAAWQDTIQVNYFSPEARMFMTNKLLELTGICDGLRCDMAMLPMNNIFSKTWRSAIQAEGLTMPSSEFWADAIQTVKKEYNEFIFIAEAYWGLEWELQQQGFDYTYDKTLYDRLLKEKAASVREHLKADKGYQSRSVRFIENHDENRAADTFGEKKSQAASIIASTLQGMHLYHDGQLEGKSVKLPAQLGREPDEQVNSALSEFYLRLLKAVKNIKENELSWQLVECSPAGENDHSNNNIISYFLHSKEVVYLVIVNYSSGTSYGRIFINTASRSDKLELNDLLNGEAYKRSQEEISTEGLFIMLDGYSGHLFQINL